MITDTNNRAHPKKKSMFDRFEQIYTIVLLYHLFASMEKKYGF